MNMNILKDLLLNITHLSECSIISFQCSKTDGGRCLNRTTPIIYLEPYIRLIIIYKISLTLNLLIAVFLHIYDNYMNMPLRHIKHLF